MRSVPRGRRAGDREAAEFAEMASRPLLIVGNGPSSAMPRPECVPADAVIFRMNWFFLESHYHFGSHVDAWFSAVPNRGLEQMLAEQMRTGRYQVDRILTPVEMPSARDGDRWPYQFIGIEHGSFDSWALPARHARLARRYMSRPGLPTTGMQALAFGLAAGFREIYISGIDLYESKTARYGYTVPEKVQAALTSKDTAPGYETNHSLGTDIAFLRDCLTEFPDASIRSLSNSETLALYLPGPQRLTERPTMSAETFPHLGRPKDRGSITLPAVEGADPLQVDEPMDGRLYAELDGRRCAYVTVVSGDYHHGARALARSLRAVSDVPLLVLATPDAEADALRASGIHTIDVPAILKPEPRHGRRGGQARFAATFSKLHAFRLDFLDRVVYVDSDALVLQNIDDLFAGDEFAAAPDSGIDLPDGRYFNSGVFAASPSTELFDAMMTAVPTTDSYDGGDQGFLNVFFPDWRRLPVEYNTTKRTASHHPAVFDIEDVKVLHYVGVKPWQPELMGGRFDQIDFQWLSHLSVGELRELVRDLRHLGKGSGKAPHSAHATAKQLAAERRWGEIEAVMEQAWKTRPPTSDEHRQLARAHRHLGRYRESLEQLRLALALEPGSVDITREVRNARLRLLYSRASKLPMGARLSSIAPAGVK